MGKLIMWNMIIFEGSEPWEIDWHVWGDELEELFATNAPGIGFICISS